MYNKSMLYLIACISKNNGLGWKGQLLFHYPEDMTFFKDRTMGNVVVMGRKTYETMGRPLEGRRNVVMTRNPHYAAPGCEVIHSIEEFWEMEETVPSGKDIYIIGGAELYKMFIDDADAIYLTEVNQLRPADTFFPQFNKDDYEVHTKSLKKDYKIVKYTRSSTL